VRRRGDQVAAAPLRAPLHAACGFLAGRQAVSDAISCLTFGTPMPVTMS
jgi:hypothetical protein